MGGWQSVVGTLFTFNFVARAAAWMMTIAFIGCMVSEGRVENVCRLNNSAVCDYSLGVGVATFALATMMLMWQAFAALADRQFTSMVLADTFLSTLCGLLWFVSFCYLLDQWRHTLRLILSPHTQHTITAAIALSFLIFVAWVCAATTAYQEYRVRRAAMQSSYAPIDERSTLPTHAPALTPYNTAG